jgi:hypothetical protein
MAGPRRGSGLSRRYAADNLSVAKWLEERRYGNQLDILLAVNPTLDLEGAEEEADRIKEIFPASEPRPPARDARRAARAPCSLPSVRASTTSSTTPVTPTSTRSNRH